MSEGERAARKTARLSLVVAGLACLLTIAQSTGLLGGGLRLRDGALVIRDPASGASIRLGNLGGGTFGWTLWDGQQGRARASTMLTGGEIWTYYSDAKGREGIRLVIGQDGRSTIACTALDGSRAGLEGGQVASQWWLRDRAGQRYLTSVWLGPDGKLKTGERVEDRPTTRPTPGATAPDTPAGDAAAPDEPTPGATSAVPEALPAPAAGAGE